MGTQAGELTWARKIFQNFRKSLKGELILRPGDPGLDVEVDEDADGEPGGRAGRGPRNSACGQGRRLSGH
jgi:hypothetical protein